MSQPVKPLAFYPGAYHTATSRVPVAKIVIIGPDEERDSFLRQCVVMSGSRTISELLGVVHAVLPNKAGDPPYFYQVLSVNNHATLQQREFFIQEATCLVLMGGQPLPEEAVSASCHVMRMPRFIGDMETLIAQIKREAVSALKPSSPDKQVGSQAFAMW